MALNLAGPQKFVESLMVDTCTLTRDTNLTADDVWNQATGTYTKAGVATLYSGKCHVTTSRPYAQAQQVIVGEMPAEYIEYYLNLPLSFTADLQRKDKVVINASRRVHLLNKTFIVENEVGTGTYTVSRRILMRLLVRTPQ